MTATAKKTLINNFLSLTLLLTLLATCDTVTGQNLRVKIYNKTGHDIDSLFVRTTYIGHISKDSATAFISFTDFRFDSGYPYEILKGVVQNKSLTQLNWSMCGTERYTRTEGEYSFDLTIRKGQDDNIYLLLDDHNTKSYLFLNDNKQ